MSSTSSQLRQAFLEYFAKHGHEVVPSSSLVPVNDPTLLFTNAGMVQFKDVFLGRESRAIPRAASSQRCVRAGGKHNDLENVGYTARHHTVFEMLGNFSFGDYFKREAIHFAWEFVTGVLELSPERLWCTVFEDDDEAADIWLKEIGVPKSRFARLGAADNFWAMGDTGPCGPCSEIFFDHGPDVEGGPPGSPNSGGDRYIEIWNLVFMQFNRNEQGELTRLPKPSVDTGMGLERLAAVMQGVHSNYEIDLFANLIKGAAAVTNTGDLDNKSLRVIADHIRACSFLITDGVVPGNEGRGYVLRRIIRRAIRHGYKLGVEEPFFYKLVKNLETEMGAAYSELAPARHHVERVLRQEEERFAETLANGMQLLDGAIGELPSGGVIAGDTVFKLYDTYGFPEDLTADIARARGYSIDKAGFERSMDAQRERGRKASRFSAAAGERPTFDKATEFLGYDCCERRACRGAARCGRPARASAGARRGRDRGARTHAVLCRERRSGGRYGRAQSGRRALHRERHPEARARIRPFRHRGLGAHRSRRPRYRGSRHPAARGHRAEPFRHASAARGAAQSARRARAAKGLARRARPVALRLLALRAGGPRAAERDRAARQRAGPPQLRRRRARAALRRSHRGRRARVLRRQIRRPRARAEARRFLHRAVRRHARQPRRRHVGLFKILSESGIAAGVRRIEAVTGQGALDLVNANEALLRDVAGLVKAGRDDVSHKVTQLVERARALEREVQTLRKKLASGGGRDILQETQVVNGIKVLAARLDGADAKALRDTADQLKDKLGSGVVVLGAVEGDKVFLVASVTKDLTAKLKAGDIIKPVAELCGGRGGGRADFAQAGGTQPDKVDAALALVPGLIAAA
jgi:alanyl-tRNA synthetase